MSARSRRYFRRARQSSSAERPRIDTDNTESESEEVNEPQVAPFAAATGTPVLQFSSPVVRIGEPVDSNVNQSMNVHEAAPQDTPTRKRRCEPTGDAPQNKQLREHSADAVLAQRPATPRPATGASDDPDIARFTDVMRRMFEETKRQGSALKNADTEELAVELIQRMRETEPITLEEAV